MNDIFNKEEAIRHLNIRIHDILMELQATDYQDTVSWRQRHTENEIQASLDKRAKLRLKMKEYQSKIEKFEEELKNEA